MLAGLALYGFLILIDGGGGVQSGTPVPVYFSAGTGLLGKGTEGKDAAGRNRRKSCETQLVGLASRDEQYRYRGASSGTGDGYGKLFCSYRYRIPISHREGGLVL